MSGPLHGQAEREQGLLAGSVISDELLQPWRTVGGGGRRHGEEMETFFDLDSRSSLSSMSLARASNYTITSAAATGTDSTITSFIYKPAPTFLLSRSNSVTTAMTGPAAATLATSTGSAQYHNWLQPQNCRPRRQSPPELDLLEAQDEIDRCDVDISGEASDRDDSSPNYQTAAFPGQYGNGFDRLSCPRPWTSRSHLRHDVGRCATPDATEPDIRVASDGSNLPSMSNMTRDEFEALPPTIQRKYFSTLERLRFAQHSSLAQYPDLAEQTAAGSPRNLASPAPRASRRESTRRPLYKRRLHTDSAIVKNRSKPRVVNASEQRFYTSLPDKIKRRHLTEEEQLLAQSRHQSVILDAADEALIKLGKRQSQQALNTTAHLADDAALSELNTPDMASAEDQSPQGEGMKTTADSLYDSFRWLEEDDDLDLRLFLDDYHINLREEMPRPSKAGRPSFRRHLSISKLPFGRSSVSFNNSRPGTKETVTSPVPTGPAHSSVPNSPAHGRKKSRALSLISPNKQALPDASTAFDPAAAHYQDPEARAKLRVYLGSPQKFDEAIEFGFPSIDEDGPGQRPPKTAESHGFLGDWGHDLGTFLEDDDKSATSSDDVTATEPESPKTPETLEKPMPLRPVRLSSEPVVSTARAGEYAQSSAASREMTLRMTLTRPDLRANEDRMYGWQKNKTVRKSVMREGAVSPLVFNNNQRDSSDPKESIERQLAMMDQENLGQDGGVVKRFWNRVRRT